MLSKFILPNRDNLVTVIGNDGQNLGVKVCREAMQIAQDQGLDLVPVGKDDSNRIVCKIYDRSKWEYEQKKNQRKQHVHSKKHELKEMRFTYRTEIHDLRTKVKKIEGMIEEGHPVRIIIGLRGREKDNVPLANEKMDEILSLFSIQIKSEDRQIRNNYNELQISITLTKG